jgi:hypothetical protein
MRPTDLIWGQVVLPCLRSARQACFGAPAFRAAVQDAPAAETVKVYKLYARRFDLGLARRVASESGLYSESLRALSCSSLP